MSGRRREVIGRDSWTACPSSSFLSFLYPCSSWGEGVAARRLMQRDGWQGGGKWGGAGVWPAGSSRGHGVWCRAGRLGTPVTSHFPPVLPPPTHPPTHTCLRLPCPPFAGLPQNTLLLYNSILALPLMVVHTMVGTNELQGVAAYPDLWNPRFLLFLLVSCSQAFLLNLCIFR